MSCVYGAGSESFAGVFDTGELPFNIICQRWSLFHFDWCVFGQPFEDSPDAQVAWDAILCGQDVSVLYSERYHQPQYHPICPHTTKVEGSKALWPEAIILSQSSDSEEPLGET